jgi:small GTP-binding protein
MNYYNFKCVVVGDSNTGKTCIIQNLISEYFKENSTTTIGVEFNIKTFNLENNLKIWTTGGENRFSNIISAYYKNTTCFIIVYDVTNRKSFENVSQWLHKISEKVNIDEKIIVMLGNKIDERDKRKVSYEEGKKLANKHNFIFKEISAKTGVNVQSSFKFLLDELNKNVEELLKKSNNGIEKVTQMFNKKPRTCFFW